MGPSSHQKVRHPGAVGRGAVAVTGSHAMWSCSSSAFDRRPSHQSSSLQRRPARNAASQPTTKLVPAAKERMAQASKLRGSVFTRRPRF